MAISADDEAWCLMIDPDGGGMQSFSRISDGFVRGRNAYECFYCGTAIPIGTRHRMMKGRCDGGLTTHRWCDDCSASTAAWAKKVFG